VGGVKFEQAMARLEAIVGELEKGDLPLDESLKIFEEGIRLSKSCLKILEDAERKVEVLLHRRGGVALDEADLDPGRRGSSAGDRDGPGVGVDPHHPTCWSDPPGERDADLPVAASDVETGHPGPDAGRGEERHRGRRHDRGLAGEPVRVGLSTVDGVPGPAHGPDATRRGHVP